MIFIALTRYDGMTVIVDFSKISCAVLLNKEEIKTTKLFMLGNMDLIVKEPWTEIEKKVEALLRIQQLVRK